MSPTFSLTYLVLKRLEGAYICIIFWESRKSRVGMLFNIPIQYIASIGHYHAIDIVNGIWLYIII